jgi:hypothetical protein
VLVSIVLQINALATIRNRPALWPVDAAVRPA